LSVGARAELLPKSTAPAPVLDTDIGCRQVEEVLIRLNYGLYA
jgi:uncharacterized protein (DUF2384 family)